MVHCGACRAPQDDELECPHCGDALDRYTAAVHFAILSEELDDQDGWPPPPPSPSPPSPPNPA